MVFDTIGDRYFVFGGSAEDDPDARNDLWVRAAYDPQQWSLVPVVGVKPAGRWGHTMEYDPVGNQLLVYGGYTATGVFADNSVWSFSLQTLTWSQMIPGGPAPGSRALHGSAMDPVQYGLLIAAGQGSSQFYNDVWRLDLTSFPTWTQLMPTGSSPTPVAGASFVADQVTGMAYLFGGQSNAGLNNNELWKLDLTNMGWIQLAVGPTRPSARAFHLARLNPQTGDLVLFGGKGQSWLNDSWVIPLRTALPTWSQITATGTPPLARSSAAGCWDPGQESLIVFGGFAGGLASQKYRNDTWELKSEPAYQWDALSGGLDVYGRYRAVGFLNPVSNRLTLSGGLANVTALEDTWSHDGASTSEWQLLAFGSPTARYGASADLAPGRGVAYLFGGYRGCFSAGCYYNDVWSFSLVSNTWGQVPISGTKPSGRWGHSLVFDPGHDRLIVFGGTDIATGSLNDLWTLDLQTLVWQSFPPSGDWPAGRSLHAVAYDLVRARMWMFGGEAGGTKLDELWYLDLATSNPIWHQVVTPLPRPTRRSETSLVYDSVSDRLILFGGGISTFPQRSNDVWALNLTGGPAWQQLTISDGPPSRRSGHIATFRPQQNQMLVATGYDNFYRDDLWVLQFGSSRSSVPDQKPSEQKKLQVLLVSPNPARTRVSATVSNQSLEAVRASVVDAAGREVCRLSDRVDYGESKLIWDTRNSQGVPVSGGIYFVTLSAQSERTTKKFIVLR